MGKVYVAMMDSESYSWVAVGETADKAKRAIYKKYKEVADYKFKSLAEFEEYYGLMAVPLDMGECKFW